MRGLLSLGSWLLPGVFVIPPVQRYGYFNMFVFASSRMRVNTKCLSRVLV
jgi:hypothetical protein